MTAEAVRDDAEVRRLAAAARQRAYRRKKPEIVSANERARHLRSGDERRARNRAYYEANRERLRRRQNEYRTQNRERLLASRRRSLDAYKADPKLRISKAISGSLLQALRGLKNGAHWESAVGYSRTELVRHLERQFVGGMSWNNFGEWHIDHIVPISSFNFQSIEDPDVRACWALSNLRPLWKRENLRKHAKRTYLI